MIPEALRAPPKWCVSKNKMPLDMHALARGLEWGASTKRSHPCYVDFDEAVRVGKIQNLPVTLLLDSSETGYYIIDIEKTCPKELRQGILLALHDHIGYIERSLSRKGYHLAVRLAAPAALSTVKHKKWVEILSAHHCTFTMDEISAADAYYDDFPENVHVDPSDEADCVLMDALAAPLTPEEFYAIIGAGRTERLMDGAGLQGYKAALPAFGAEHADLFGMLCGVAYAKTVDGDFGGDISRWEFGYASKLHYALQRFARDMTASDGSHYEVPLSMEQAVMLVFMVMKQSLAPREKHKSVRNGLPWLLYTSEQVYVKTFGTRPGGK